MEYDDLLVSIIIPVHNTPLSDYKKCLESIYNQSHKKFELIVVDDGSDPQYKIHYKKLCKGKYIYQNKSGVSSARNKGLNQAIGKYILFMDSDDYISNDYIEKMLNGIRRNNSKIAIAGMQEMNNKGKKIRKVKLAALSDKGHDISYYLLNDSQNYMVTGKLIKKECIGNSRFNTNMKYSEDVLFMLDIIKNNRVAYINYYGYYYRRGAYSSTYSFNYDSAIKYAKDSTTYIDTLSARYNIRYDQTVRERYKRLSNIATRYIRAENASFNNFMKLIKTSETIIFNKGRKVKFSSNIRILLLSTKLYFILYFLLKVKRTFKI